MVSHQKVPPSLCIAAQSCANTSTTSRLDGRVCSYRPSLPFQFLYNVFLACELSSLTIPTYLYPGGLYASPSLSGSRYVPRLFLGNATVCLILILLSLIFFYYSCDACMQILASRSFVDAPCPFSSPCFTCISQPALMILFVVLLVIASSSPAFSRRTAQICATMIRPGALIAGTWAAMQYMGQE